MTQQTDLIRKIKVLMAHEDVNYTELAKRLGLSPPTITNKFKRGTFAEKDLLKIAAACDAKLEITFVTKDGTRI